MYGDCGQTQGLHGSAQIMSDSKFQGQEPIYSSQAPDQPSRDQAALSKLPPWNPEDDLVSWLLRNWLSGPRALTVTVLYSVCQLRTLCPLARRLAPGTRLCLFAKKKADKRGV